MPELTKPKTLPIWPGGAASFTITSRGMRLAAVITPATNSAAIVGSSAGEMTLISSNSAAAPMVNISPRQPLRVPSRCEERRQSFNLSRDAGCSRRTAELRLSARLPACPVNLN
jgi:hypothetical protein